MPSIVQQNRQIIERLTEKTWGQGWVDLVMNTKWRKISREEMIAEEIGKLLAKNMARIARRQLDGRNLRLFGEYLQNWTTLYLLNLPINMHYRKATSMEVIMFLACFWTRNYLEWIIKQLLNSAFVSSEDMEISEGVIRHDTKAEFNNC